MVAHCGNCQAFFVAETERQSAGILNERRAQQKYEVLVILLFIVTTGSIFTIHHEEWRVLEDLLHVQVPYLATGTSCRWEVSQVMAF